MGFPVLMVLLGLNTFGQHGNAKPSLAASPRKLSTLADMPSNPPFSWRRPRFDVNAGLLPRRFPHNPVIDLLIVEDTKSNLKKGLIVEVEIVWVILQMVAKIDSFIVGLTKKSISQISHLIAL